MQNHALQIARSYHDIQSWLSAAETLRAPYWDWATNSVPPPQVIQQQTVTILAAPDGRPTTVTNPLYQYTFDPNDTRSFPSPWNSWRTTIRSPDNPDSPNATTDVQLLISYDFTLPDPSIIHSFHLK
jgi:tyrosinase